MPGTCKHMPLPRAWALAAYVACPSGRAGETDQDKLFGLLGTSHYEYRYELSMELQDTEGGRGPAHAVASLPAGPCLLPL